MRQGKIIAYILAFACLIPAVYVFYNPGHTPSGQLGIDAALTVLFVSFPLAILGIIFLLIGLFIPSKKK